MYTHERRKKCHEYSNTFDVSHAIDKKNDTIHCHPFRRNTDISKTFHFVSFHYTLFTYLNRSNCSTGMHHILYDR